MSTPQPTDNSRTANADQAEAWNGPTGAKWVRFQDRLDHMLSPFCDALLDAAAIRTGESILDVGCGCGVTTLEAAKRAGPTGHTLGIDLSAPMTARARERSAALGLTAQFQVADASAHDFGTAKFDLLMSRFGVMFFDAPVPAFAKLHRALAPGARMAFVCWRPLLENAWLAAPMRAAKPLLPPLEPAIPHAPGPFAFADKDRVSGLLSEAGFRDISFTPFDAPLVLGLGLDEALEQALEIGPLSRLIADQPKDLQARVGAVVREELAKHLTPAGVALNGATWIVQASA